MHFSRQIKDQNSGRKLKNQTNDLIFSSTFSTLFVIFIFVFENNQNSFSCCPPFDPFWFVKFRNSQQKLPIWTIHHTFIESKHREVAKTPCYVLFLKDSHFILYIVCIWPLFCSVQGYISLYFLPLWICNFPLSLFNKSPFFCQAYYTILLNLTNLAFEFIFILKCIFCLLQ